MSDESDQSLLQAFASRGDAAAFAEVVRRWGSLVYGAALRRTGDRALAEDVSQHVMITLARRAGELARHPALAAWLHKAASYEAARAMEKESNRRRYMKRYAEEWAGTGDGGAADPVWREALPELDAALADLSEKDRQILLKRYWQRQPFRAIAEAAGSSVAACEKRAERAVAKLSSLLRRRGVTVSAGVLAAGLTPALSEARVPPVVLDQLASTAVDAAFNVPGPSTLAATLTLMKSKLIPVAALLLVAGLSGAGGFLAARSLPVTSPVVSTTSRGGQAEGGLAPTPPVLGGGGSRRPSLRAVLAAAQRDLATASVDPAAAARAAARVDVIPLEDIRAALSVADEMAAATGDSSPLVALILQRWAELDPQAACQTAMARGSGRFLGLPALAEPLKVWAARDPQSAFDWYRAQASEAETKAGADQRWKPVSSLRWIMGAWALRDATAAAKAFASLTKPEEINGALTGFSELSGTAPGRTAILDAWLGLPAEHRRGFMDLRSVFQRWSLHDPAELAAWLDRSGVEKSEHTTTAQPILSAWLREDPEAARDWWFQSPGGYEDRGHRLQSLVTAWAEADVFAAADWLATQPLDATASGSMAALAAQVARSDPERGWEWAMKIPDAATRADALRQVVSTWAATDRDAAAAAIASAVLDEPVQADLRKALPPVP